MSTAPVGPPLVLLVPPQHLHPSETCHRQLSNSFRYSAMQSAAAALLLRVWRSNRLNASPTDVTRCGLYL